MTLAQAFTKNYDTLMKLGRYQRMQVCSEEAPGGGYFCTLAVGHPQGTFHLAQDHTGQTLLAWPVRAWEARFQRRNTEGEG